MINVTIPLSFKQRIKDVNGEKGAAWLLALSKLLQKYANQWELTLIQPVSKLSYNFVIHSRNATGTDVILKLGVPGTEIESEVAALASYEGRGCVKLLHHSLTDGAILIEEARPGTSIQELTLNGRDKEAVLIASQVIKRLQAPSKEGMSQFHPFRTVDDWADGFQRIKAAFGGTTGPFDSQLVDRAEREYRQMSATTAKRVLLHGDLHHGNILSAAREPWLAIDPKGILGDPSYEVGAFIRNPMPDLMAFPNVKDMLHDRIDLFSETLRFERKRVWAWSFSQTVLAAWWLFEDRQEGWESWLNLAEVLLEME